MAEQLSHFIREHPEFFEAKGDYWRLHRDVSGLMDRYAQALNPEEYAALRARMEAVRHKECQRLQQQIDEWIIERGRQQEKQREAAAEFSQMEAQLNKIRRRIDKAKQQLTERPQHTKQWYHSGLVYLALALFGILFLYLGIILNKRISPGYVMAGLACIATGILLQRGESGPASQGAGSKQLMELSEEERKFLQIARIKKATLIERKKVANKSIASLNAKIDDHLAKLDILNG
jgi:hypothetical protein